MFDEIDEDDYKKLVRKIYRTTGEYRDLLSILKTDGDHLTAAAKEVIKVGLDRGWSKKRIAEVLHVTPAAITYHSR
jgi:hypothetical protein